MKRYINGFLEKYMFTVAGRIKVIQALGNFGVVGGIIVTVLLLSATFL